VGLLAVFAFLFHFAAPTLYELAGPAADGLTKTFICSGGFAKEVYLDKDGKPVQPGKTDHEDCKFSCAHHCAAMFASTLALAKPSWAILLGMLVGPTHGGDHVAGASAPRGPPPA